MFYFDRRAELITESGYKFRTWEGVRFQFKYTTMAETGLPVLELDILNIDKELRNSIEEENAIFNIGYGSNLGDLTSGYIKNIEHENNEISFEIMSDSDKFTKEYSTWYERSITAKFVVEDIAKSLGVTILNSNLLKSFRFPNGMTVKGPGITSIKRVANKFGISVTTRGNAVELYKPRVSGTGSILLNDSSGLLNVNRYQKEDEKYDYIIEALPVPGITQGDFLKVIHDNLNAAVKVMDFEIYGRMNWVAYYYVKVVG